MVEFPCPLMLESNLFHPDDGYGEGSPETVEHLQHFRGSKHCLSFLYLWVNIGTNGNFVDESSPGRVNIKRCFGELCDTVPWNV